MHEESGLVQGSVASHMMFACIGVAGLTVTMKQTNKLLAHALAIAVIKLW